MNFNREPRQLRERKGCSRGSCISRFKSARSGLLARSAHSGTARTNHTHAYYHADGNGNITYLQTSAQGLGASYRYDAYGNTVASSGSLASANTYRFSSKMMEPNTGLYYYCYRWYSPSLQRWLNRDPLGDQGFIVERSVTRALASVPIAERIDGPNLFAFVKNGSLDSIDLFGMYSVPGIPFPCPPLFTAGCLVACGKLDMLPNPKCTITMIAGEIYIVMDCNCWIPPWCNK
jgi:RHS repeat-associated protein